MKFEGLVDRQRGIKEYKYSLLEYDKATSGAAEYPFLPFEFLKCPRLLRDVKRVFVSKVRSFFHGFSAGDIQ